MADSEIKYEEIGKNYRFFLTWRYGIFAAHLVVLWSAFSISFNLLEKKVDPFIVGIILIVAAIICLCLWIAELRNRELYRGLIQKGKLLEDSVNQSYSILSDLSKVNKRWRIITQSISLDILAYTCFTTLINSAIIFMNKPDFLVFDFNQVSSDSKNIMIVINILFFIIIDPFGLKYIYINRKNKKKKS
jgi:hypothetical protein